MNIRFVFFFYLLFLSPLFLGQSQSWRIEISLNDRLQLPFFLHKTIDNAYVVVNGSEHIKLGDRTKGKDTIELQFIEMDSYLCFAFEDSMNIRGYWKNKKGRLYPLTGTLGKQNRFESSTKEPPKKVFSSYEVTFGKKKGTWPAVGLFEQNQELITGTFLTETGDYRFLEGNVFGNQLYLSCFDGAHAFVFTAKIKGDSLNGFFYSGSSYSTVWKGVRNENAKIGDPDSLTYVQADNYDLSKVQFRSLSGFKKRFDYSKNRLTILQIMGSWCPNCLDETNYFKEIYPLYKENGLEIIALGFESQNSKRKRRKHLKKFKQKASIPYEIYLGGKASKKEASKIFSMLNGISSFPTTLFVNSKGEIIHIHTGFYGPGTGVYYDQYKKQTEGLIESILQE